MPPDPLESSCFTFRVCSTTHIHVSAAILNFDLLPKSLDPPLGYMANFMHYILPSFRLCKVNCQVYRQWTPDTTHIWELIYCWDFITTIRFLNSINHTVYTTNHLMQWVWRHLVSTTNPEPLIASMAACNLTLVPNPVLAMSPSVAQLKIINIRFDKFLLVLLIFVDSYTAFGIHVMLK